MAKKAIKILGIFLVLGLALFIRLKDLHHWQKYKQYCYYKGQPLLTTLDAYYHLRLARDIIQGNYKAKDEKRCPPDYIARPKVPPLLSILAAYLSKFSGLSLNWIGLLLPPVLGCLVIIPCFLWGSAFGGYLTGLASSLLTVTGYIYYHRTRIGWFDTDILNVFFIFIIPYFLLLYCREKNKRRYFYLFSSLVLSFIFVWWWYPACFLVGFLVFIPLFTSIFLYKESKVEIGIKLAIICAIIGFMILKYHGIKEIILFLSKRQTEANFISIAASISELKRPPFQRIVKMSSGHISIFILGLLGWLVLMIKRYKETTFLYVPLFVASFTFLFSQRFMIFLIPFIGFGLGYIAYIISKRIEKRQYCPLFYPLLIIGIFASIFPSIRRDWTTKFSPKMPAPVIKGLDYINKTAPPDAFIWCWWDLGYTAQYWANRGTFVDGGTQNPERTFFSALPLATSNWNLSANIIKFLSYHGKSGFNKLVSKFGQERAIDILKTVLSASPNEQKMVLKKRNLEPNKWEPFFFPKKVRKIYLVLDGTLPGKAYWWYYFGSWDIKRKKGTHPIIFPIRNCEINNNQIISSAGLKIDLNTGLVSYKGNQLFLRELLIYNIKTGKIHKRYFFIRDGLVFEFISPLRIGFLVSEGFYESVFNKLFILNIYRKGLFRPIYSKYMFIQVWEVL